MIDTVHPASSNSKVIGLPTILEVDTAQMYAAGETIWHAGVTVYLTENVPAQYLTVVDNEDPEYVLARARWQEEE